MLRSQHPLLARARPRQSRRGRRGLRWRGGSSGNGAVDACFSARRLGSLRLCSSNSSNAANSRPLILQSSLRWIHAGAKRGRRSSPFRARQGRRDIGRSLRLSALTERSASSRKAWSSLSALEMIFSRPELAPGGAAVSSAPERAGSKPPCPRLSSGFMTCQVVVAVLWSLPNGPSGAELCPPA